MIYAEYILDGKFDAIETEVFSKLDHLVHTPMPPTAAQSSSGV